ncbi:MAG: hypothetical protein LUG61_01730 [Lachnospiraceae bacterium]|nr:hypothetical protein [Lachnospiraceae bacterium]
MMNKNDISDAMAFLDEDMIRHTELLHKKYAREIRGNRRKREQLRFGAAAAACLLLLGILTALMAVALNRGLFTGLKEQGEGMTVQENGQSGSEDLAAFRSEENAAEGSEDFVAIETLLAQLEQEEEGTSTEKSTMDMLLSAVDLGEYVGLYEVIYQSHSEGGLLSESVGGMATEIADGYYRVAGHDDLQYLIYKETHAVYAGEGTYAYTEDGELIEADYYFLLKFVCFDSEEYPFSDVLSLVYQIHSAEDIQQILVKPSKADNTDTGKALQEQIGENTVTDSADIEAFYEILSSITCYGCDRWDLIDTGNWDIPADSAADYDSQTWSRILVERYLTITTDYGNEIDSLKYTAYSDMFFEFNGIAYSALTEEQAELICEILGIDTDGTVS